MPAPTERPDTLLIHSDRDESADGALAPAIHPSVTHAARDAAEFAEMATRPRHPRFYTRYGNPTHERVARLVARLEGGEAALMAASGMGAISAVMLGLLGAGDRVVAQTSHYMGTTQLFTELLPRFGVRVELVEQSDTTGLVAAIRRGARLVMVETPSNPTMALTDLRAVADAARAVGAISVADNTFATPLNQQPLAFGIDAVVHSATKYLGGHHDLIAGVVVSRNALIDRIWQSTIALGSTLGAFDAWLLLRGMRTLSLRVARANDNALAVARFLEKHQAVEAVHYPGLDSHPQHALAREQMRGFGGVLAVRLRGDYERTQRFVSRLRLFTQAVSLGGVESLVVHAAAMVRGTLDEQQMRDAGIAPNLVRLACGIEAAQDLVADLAQALD
ncbi:MAG TPA: aminotransferase class I/II-fold pyridoxal phosphate-dependent enzyme [Burkholderiaceae bacterium]|jgi:methionine-gamma-lyase|nr:aminotransferase class I/II-fold pyridoxal phosphate-dependent enzyme [Burkholderiaceae bacterium]HRA78041.1 aminotransferase class I/II-fold pyridoxal phosphate-dependent enzyme [Burkholderiaceae bacterium]